MPYEFVARRPRTLKHPPKRSIEAKASRGALVVRRILAAALHELAREGYASLRVDDVARLAGVNKTTVYRRWPTKGALVRAALLSLVDRGGEPAAIPDAGSLRRDFAALVSNRLSYARSTEGKAVLRVIAEPGVEADIVSIARSLCGPRDVVVRTVLERARARGMLRRDVDMRLLIELVQVGCDRVCSGAERASARAAERLVDLLLWGAAVRNRNSKLRRAPR